MSHFILTDTEDSGTTVGVFDSFEDARDHAEKIAAPGSRESGYRANAIEQWDGAESVNIWTRKLTWVDDGFTAWGTPSGYYTATPEWR